MLKHWNTYEMEMINDFVECFPEFEDYRENLSIFDDNGTLEYKNEGYDFLIDFNLPSYLSWIEIAGY